MQITRIDIEGIRDARDKNDLGRHASITRKRDSEFIEVTIYAPTMPDGLIKYVMADCDEDIWSMAECLQETLDGQRGTNSMIHDYYRQIQTFAD